MVLTSRQRKIAHRLLNSSKVLTEKDLSKELSVSTRTISNDLDKVSKWIDKNEGSEYKSKPGKGIWVDFVNEKYRKITINNLEVTERTEKDNRYYSFEDRQWKIISYLEFNFKFHTGKELSELTKVSINTLLSDLQSVKKQLKNFDLELIGKKYYGYTIKGLEINHRNLMEYIIQRKINKYTFLAKNINEYLLSISFEIAKDSELPKKLREYISSISLLLINNLQDQTNKSAEKLEIVKSMVNRLAIIVYRSKQNNKLIRKSKLIKNVDSFYRGIYENVIHLFNLEFQPSEYDYFIHGGRMYDKEIHADKLSLLLINFVSNKLNVPLEKNMQLQDALTQHLMMKINNNYQYLSEYTPFTEEVKRKYRFLFKVVKQALFKYISNSPVVVDDTFITLISLHFLSAISELKVKQKIKVLYVCSTGLGASSLLQRLIENKIQNIESVGFASSINYKNKIKKLKPNLVISIFPLDKRSNLPVVQVNPIPTDEDLNIIQKTIKNLSKDTLNNYSLDSPKENKSFSFNNQEEIIKIISLTLQSSVQLKNYLSRKIDPKYEDAFLIHTQLATIRIIFNNQYQFSSSDEEIRKFLPEDVVFVKTIFKGLGLNINNSEIVALLRYTQLK